MNKTRVLLVDDEESFTRLLKKNLEILGRYQVQVENRGPHGVTTAMDFHPDIILLDVMMPGMDGGEVAARVKDHPRLKNTPIVFLTAAVKAEELKSHGGIIGGFAYLAKPVDVDDIVEMIDRNLAQAAV